MSSASQPLAVLRSMRALRNKSDGSYAAEERLRRRVTLPRRSSISSSFKCG